MAIAGGRFRVLVDRYNDRLDVLVAIALAGSPAGWQGCWPSGRIEIDCLNQKSNRGKITSTLPFVARREARKGPSSPLSRLLYFAVVLLYCRRWSG